MTKPILHEERIHLQEGNEYEFMLVDRVLLQDNKEYFILSDPNGMKHFLEAAPYESYQIKKSSRIHCLVSKINCTGRIFLEPEHPIYKIGQIYHFQVYASRSNDQQADIEIGDSHGNRWVLKPDKDQNHSILAGSTIKCLIKYFKKGIPEFIIS